MKNNYYGILCDDLSDEDLILNNNVNVEEAMGYPNQRPNPDKRLERERQRQEKSNLKKELGNTKSSANNSLNHKNPSDYTALSFNKINDLMQRRKGQDNYQNIHDTKYTYEILGEFSQLLFKEMTGFNIIITKHEPKRHVNGTIYVFLKNNALHCTINKKNRVWSQDWLITKIKMNHSLTLVDMTALVDINLLIQKTIENYDRIDQVIRKMGNTFYDHTEHFQKIRHLAIFTCETILERLNEQYANTNNDIYKKVLLNLIHLYPYHNEEFRRNKYYSKYLELGGDITKIKQDPKYYGSFYDQNKVLESYSATSKFDNLKLTWQTILPENTGQESCSECDELPKIYPTEVIQANKVINSVDRLDINQDGVIWKNLYGFTVLTGKNGSGKTRVLNSIYQELRSLKIKYLYMNSEATMLRNVFGQNGSDFKYEYVRNGLKWYFDLTDMKQREKVFSKKSLDRNINDKIALAIADEYFCGEYKIEDPLKIEDSKIRETAERLAFSEGSIIEPISFARNLCWQYSIYTSKDKDANNDLINQRSALNTLYKEQYSEFNTKFDEYKVIVDLALSQQFQSNNSIINPIHNINFLLRRYFPDFSVRYELDKNKFIKEIWMLDDNNKKDNYEGYELLFLKNNRKISINDLSSGELVIIKLIFWAYVSKGLDFEKRKNEDYTKPRSDVETEVNVQAEDQKASGNVKLLLLDEIDKHFDPKLTEIALSILKNEFKHAQIIITTHRPDTIALIPQVSIDKREAGIFAIKDIKSIDRSTDTEMKGEQEPKRTKEIVEITKLEAMYRLTKNLRQFTGHRFEVCTEGFYDAYFYSGVYHSLLDMSKNTPRDSNVGYHVDNLLPKNIMPKNLYAYDITTGEQKFIARALSQRYQMFFRGSSKTDGKGGIKASGAAGDVVTMIERDATAFKNADNVPSKYICNDIFSNGEFYIPYGIIDADGKTEKSSNDRVVKPSNKFSLKEDNESDAGRYTVENFALDPIVLCSILEENEIEEWVNQSLINSDKKAEMKEICLQIKCKLNEIKKGDQLNFGLMNTLISKYFCYVVSAINATITSYEQNELQDYLKSNITILDLEKQKSYIEPLLKRINEHKSTDDEPIKANGIEKKIKKFLDSKEAEINFPLYHNKKTSDVSLKKLDNQNYQSNCKISSLQGLKGKILNTENHSEIIHLNSIVIELNKINSLNIDTNNTEKSDPKQIILEKIKKAETRKIDYLFSYSDDQTYIATFEYPKWFLELNGHYLEYYCFGMKIADKIATKVRAQGLSFIPLDIAQVFFDLNEKIRRNVRRVIKKSERDPNNNLNQLSGQDNDDNYNNKDDYSKRNSGHNIDNLDKAGNSGLNNHNSNKSQNTSSNDKLNNENKPEHKDGTSLNTGQIKNISLLDDIKTKGDTYWYTDEDMNSLGTKKLEMHGIDCDKQFKGRLTEDVVRNLPEANDRRDADGDTINGLEEGKPMFICYNIGGLFNQNGGTHWVAICLVKYEHRIHVLYKDSKYNFNQSAQGVLWKFWERYGQEISFAIHDGNEQTDSSSCGPMTINNLSIMADLIQKKGIEYLVKNFKDISFSKQSDVSKIRSEHYDILENINQNTHVVSSNIPQSDHILADERSRELVYRQNKNISFLNKISYTDPNLMLRQGDMLGQAGGIAGMDGINLLISLGEDPEVAKAIIRSAEEYGIPTVLSPLMDDIRMNTLSNAAVVNSAIVNPNVNIDNSQSVKRTWVDRCSTLATSRNCSTGL